MILALAIAAISSPTSNCVAPMGEIVPTASVARQIAEAVIENMQLKPTRMKYVLRVVEDETGEWLAFQVPVRSPQ